MQMIQAYNDNSDAYSRQQPVVRFSFVSVSKTASPMDLLQSWEEWEAMWYTNTELDHFRRKARDTYVILKKEANIKCKESSRENSTLVCDPSQQKSNGVMGQKPTMALSSRSRGLEARYCLERRRRAAVALKCIVRSASKLFRYEDAVKLAELAQSCTAWATALALEEGARDFVRAHSEFFTKRKWTRYFDDSLVTSRNVRRKCI